MRFHEILVEATANDHENILLAVDAYDHLYHWLAETFGTRMLDNPTIPDGMYEPPWAPGGYAIMAETAGLQAPQLILCFVKGRGGIPPAFALTRAGEPVLVLPLLTAKRDLSGIASAFRDRSTRSEFIHEFVHFRQWLETGEAPSSAAPSLADHGGATTDYYNDPHEIDAFFSEAAGSALAWLREHLDIHSRSLIKPWTTMPDTVLAREIRDQFFDFNFVKHLTPANRRQMNDRLLRFIRVVIRPLFTPP